MTVWSVAVLSRQGTGRVINDTGVLPHTNTVLGPGTGFVLRVHPSNYRIEGFTSTPDIVELAGACRAAGVSLVADAGSGLLRGEPLLPEEPDAMTWLAQGADLVTASGDLDLLAVPPEEDDDLLLLLNDLRG